MNKQQINAKLRQLEQASRALHRQYGEILNVEAGDIPSPAQKKLIKGQKFAYQATFLRRKPLKKVKQKGEVRTSARRFSSRKEALQHAKRFSKIHRHRSFTIARVNKRANAWVNWKTGKTNPAL